MHFPLQTHLIFIFSEVDTRWTAVQTVSRFFFFFLNGNLFTRLGLHGKHYAFIRSVFVLHTHQASHFCSDICASADVAADEMTEETGGNWGSLWSPCHTEKPAVGVTLSSQLLCEPSWLVRCSLHSDRLSSSYFSFSKPCSVVIFNLLLSVELS